MVDGQPDYQGIALLLGALGVFFSSTVGTILTVVSYRAGLRRDTKLEEVHQAVNGLSDKRDAATAKASFAAGQKDEKERHSDG